MFHLAHINLSIYRLVLYCCTYFSLVQYMQAKLAGCQSAILLKLTGRENERNDCNLGRIIKKS